MKTYYILGKDDAVLGPVDLGELKTMLNKEKVTAETMVCVAGEQEWHRIGELFETEIPTKTLINTLRAAKERSTNRSSGDGNSSWYIYKQGAVEIGPVSKEELQELFRSGKITYKTPVRIGNKKEWVTYNNLMLWWRQSLTMAWNGPTEEVMKNKKPPYSDKPEENGLKWSWDEPKRGNNPKPSTQIPRPKFKAPKKQHHTRSEGSELATLWRIIGTLTCLSWIIIALVWQDDMPVYVILSVILGSIISLMLCLTLATVVHACAIYIARHQQPTP